jgi:glycosyltransferase involved in cell wall biosynthesis
MKGKKILFYVGDLGFGGAERQLIYTALSAIKKGYKVKIVIDRPVVQYEEMLFDSGIEILCTNTSKYAPIKRYIRLSQVVSSFSPDILHSFLGTKNLWGMAVARKQGVSVKIASIRNTDKKEFIGIHLYKNWADKIICNTRLAADIAKKEYGVPEEKLAVVYNAIDLKRFKEAKPLTDLRVSLGLPENTILGVTVARFAEQKNHLGLIRALKILHQEGLLDNIHYLLVGNPADRELFEKISSEIKISGLSQKVTYLGVRQDIPEILKSCDFMVLPSFYEGFPNVVLEAMAAGVFVIATPTGGTPELVEDWVNGLLASGTEPQDLAFSIEKYIKMPSLNKTNILIAASNKTEEHSQLNIFKQIEILY